MKNRFVSFPYQSGNSHIFSCWKCILHQKCLKVSKYDFRSRQAVLNMCIFVFQIETLVGWRWSQGSVFQWIMLRWKTLQTFSKSTSTSCITRTCCLQKSSACKVLVPSLRWKWIDNHSFPKFYPEHVQSRASKMLHSWLCYKSHANDMCE